MAKKTAAKKAGAKTAKKEVTGGFSKDVIELIKTAVAGGYDKQQFEEGLKAKATAFLEAKKQ